MITLFKALADETRLRLLNILNQHELNVNEIVEIMQMGQSRISRHLKILADSSLVTFRRDGLWVFYSVARDGAGRRLVDSIEFLFSSDPFFTEDIHRAHDVIAERARHSVRFFDSVATDWTRMRRELLGNFDLSAEIVRRISSQGVIVDLGCGSGELLPLLAKCGCHVIGVDRSMKMLEEARKQFERQHLAIDLRIGELEHLPLREHEADTVILNMVLHHLHSPLVCLREVYRVLNERGTVIIAEFLDHQNEELRRRYHDRWLGFSQEDITGWLSECNFTIRENHCFALERGLEICIYTAMNH